MKHFAKIDLKSVHNQMEIDDKFKEITTLISHIGFLRWSRFLFGIKQLLIFFKEPSRKRDNIIIYQDDICLETRTREELKSKTEQVPMRLKEAGMTIKTNAN